LRNKGVICVPRILIVDDSPTVRRYYRKVLEDSGYQADEAVSGSEALEKVYMEKYDLLLVDINMPKMDGYSFIREVRRAEDIEPIPILIISTEGAVGDMELGFQAGCNMYLVKPVDPKELLAYVELLG